MQFLEQKIDDLRKKFAAVQLLTDSITTEPADETLKKIQLAKADIDFVVQQLKAQYPDDVLKPFNPEFAEAAKQISKSFDNVITNHKNELALIQSELSKLNSQRKILNYQR